VSAIDNMTIILVGLSLIATYLNILKRSVCFKIWVVTNMAWAAYDIYKTAYWQAFLFLAYAGLAIYGIVKWKDSDV